jgi:hypothetical protein
MQPAMQPNGIDARIGTGNWAAFTISLECVFKAAAEWKQRLIGVKNPWLCWNVSPQWSVVQQRLINHFGWTPVVGFDPRVGPPPLEDGAILIDFNERFQFPVMWPHFPLEFAYLFAPRLAFWHADLLCRLPVMEKLVKMFDSLEDGETAAVLDKGGRRNYLNFKSHRYWELCGCTTRMASENQFYNGTGWWRYFQMHPQCAPEKERRRRAAYSWDSGVGILYWQTKYNGSVKPIDIHLVKEGHCSEIMAKEYRSAPGHKTALRDLQSELDTNYSLESEARRLELDRFLR